MPHARPEAYHGAKETQTFHPREYDEWSRPELRPMPTDSQV